MRSPVARSPLRGVGVVVTAALIMVACSSGGDSVADTSGASSSPSVAPTPDEATTPTETSAPVSTDAVTAPPVGTLADLFSFVPDTGAARSEPIPFARFDRMRAGEAPTTAQDDLRLIFERYDFAVLGAYRFRECLGDDECRPGLGFDTTTVSAMLSYGPQDDFVDVFWGTFDAGSMEAAIRKGAPEQELEVRVDGEVTYLSAGVDGRTAVRERTIHRPLGVALRMAIGPTWMVVGRSSATVEASVAAHRGASLVDADDVSSVVDALDSAGVFVGMVVPDPPDPAWTVIAAGEVPSTDGDRYTMDPAVVTLLAVAADAGDASIAAGNVPIWVERGYRDFGYGTSFDDPVSDVLEVEDVRSVGPLLHATLRAVAGGVSYSLVSTDTWGLWS